VHSLVLSAEPSNEHYATLEAYVEALHTTTTFTVDTGSTVYYGCRVMNVERDTFGRLTVGLICDPYAGALVATRKVPK
jgi:hypothetical protein